MALLTANGHAVVAAMIDLPLTGAWHVDMTVDSADADALTGDVTLDIQEGALSFTGTARRVGTYLDSVRVRIIAGANGLGKDASPKYYQQQQVRQILQDLLNTGGESLSATADSGMLSRLLPTWKIMGTTVGNAISTLVTFLGASWRFLPDGSFWCGTESWPDSAAEVSIEAKDNASGHMVVTSEAPLLLPGTVFQEHWAGHVEHNVDHNGVTSTVWLQDDGSSTDRSNAAMDAMVKAALPSIDFLGLYRARVVSQSGNKLDLIPDDTRLSNMSAVPIRHGIPGLELQVIPGAYVLVGWWNGDPSMPYCCLWEGGETPIKLTVNAQIIELGGSNLVPLTDGVVLASGIDSLTGSTYGALNNASTRVMAKKV